MTLDTQNDQKSKVKSQKFGAGANCCAQLRGRGELGKLKEGKPCLAKTQGAQRKQRGFFARFAPLRDNFVFSCSFSRPSVAGKSHRLFNPASAGGRADL